VGTWEHCRKASNKLGTLHWLAAGAVLLALAPGVGFSEERTRSEPVEFLSAEPPPAWKMSYSYAVRGLEVLEFIPQRQTLEDWRDMITVQTMAGDNSNAADLLRDISARAKAICLKVLSSPVIEHKESGHPAATMTQFCLRDAESLTGDVTLYRVVRGMQALYVLTRTRRGEAYDGTSIPLSETTHAQWRTELRSFLICRRGAAGIECGANY